LAASLAVQRARVSAAINHRKLQFSHNPRIKK
jgi:hypothetical protein